MQKWIFKTILFVLVSVAVNGCMSKTTEKARQSINRAYSKVVLSDGIDENEASFLAEKYFTWYVSGCGATGEVLDNGDQWEIKTVIGVAAKPYESIFVDKKTGTITCPEGPTIEAPKKIKGI